MHVRSDKAENGIHRQCDLPPGHLFDSEGDPRGASYIQFHINSHNSQRNFNQVSSRNGFEAPIANYLLLCSLFLRAIMSYGIHSIASTHLHPYTGHAQLIRCRLLGTSILSPLHGRCNTAETTYRDESPASSHIGLLRP